MDVPDRAFLVNGGGSRLQVILSAPIDLSCITLTI